MAIKPLTVASWGLLGQLWATVGDPIKTRLLKELQAQLAEIPELGSVQRWEDVPADLNEYSLPALFFWEEEEKEDINRLTHGILDFWLQVFFSLDSDDPANYTAFSEAADTVAGRIGNLFTDNRYLRSVGLIRAEPGRIIKAKHNPDYGVLFMSYSLLYGHARGDAFTTQI